MTNRLLVGRQRETETETETETERRGIHREAGRRGGERWGSESWRSASTARRIGWHIARRRMKQLVGQAFFMGGLQEPGADVPVSLDPRSSGRQPSRVHATWKQPTPSEHARTRTLFSRLPASPPPCESSLPLFRPTSRCCRRRYAPRQTGRSLGGPLVADGTLVRLLAAETDEGSMHLHLRPKLMAGQVAGASKALIHSGRSLGLRTACR